jgi:hypothetical protein
MEKVNFNGPMEFPLRELLKKGISMVRDFWRTQAFNILTKETTNMESNMEKA